MSALIEHAEEYRLSSQQSAAHVADCHRPEFSVAILLEGPAEDFSLERAQQAIERMVHRHEILRTRYRAVPGMRFPLQSVVADLPVTCMAVEDDVSHEQLIAATRSLLGTQGSAVGVAISRAKERVRVAVAAPGLNVDAQGIQALAGACLADDVANGDDGKEVLQYLDYVAWQQELFGTDLGKEGARYWELCAQELRNPLHLPFESRGGGAVATRTTSQAIELGTPASETIHAIAHDIGVTTEQAVLALWAGFLARIGQTDALAIEWRCAVRAEELQGALGCYVTPLPVLIRLDAMSARALVAAVAEQLQPAASWHECFDATAYHDALARHGRSRPAIAFEFVQQQQLPRGWHCCRIDTHPGDTRLRCDVLESQRGFTLQLHSRGVFGPRVLDVWVRQFATMLTSFAEHPGATWNELSLISAAEREVLLGLGRVEQVPTIPAHTLLHQLFEMQARCSPEACAVICGGERITYAELDARANELAIRLQSLGAGPDQLIGIHIGRSPHTITAILAVLKAGAAYVPIDPTYPTDRIVHVLDDAAISTLIVQSSDRERLSGLARNIVSADERGLEGGTLRVPANLTDANLAYVIYTSGSTGRPKGVMVSHGNALASTRARFAFYAEPVSSYLLLSSFSFDSSVAGVFWTLGQGGTLCIPTDEQHQDPIQIAALIAGSAISHVLALPSFYKQIVAATDDAPSLRCAIVAGEACHVDVVEQHRRKMPHASLVNEYGPTEGTVWSHAYDIADVCEERVPIGRPIHSITSVVLDAAMQLCPLGVAGELYIGGSGITRGYLNRGGLTAQRYVADPFGAGQRLYRTGDLVRYRPDGELEYLGRIDHQVKIRGFRIELGEIEARLLTQAGIKDAVAVAKESPGGLRLVAYVTSQTSRPVDATALREELGKSLPAYMVPGAIVFLERLPLMPNGKVDRQALPDPDVSKLRIYEAPRDDAEAAFCNVWQDVLGVERVGRNDNLFELGGDSIIGLQIVARLRKAGWKLTPRQLFEGQTVGRIVTLAERIDGDASGRQSTAVGEVPLLPIQAEFFQMQLESRHHWNQTVLLRPRQALDLPALRRALTALVTHHDSLRLRYRRDADGSWRQVYEPVSEDRLQESLSIRQASDARRIEALCDEAQRSLNLEHGPLLRALAIEVADGSWRLLLVIHHLVVDGVSWRVLLEDLQTGYEQCLARRDIVLPEKTSSYKDWALALQRYCQHHGEEIAYWRKLIDVPVTLPCMHPQGANTVADQCAVEMKLNRTQTEALLKEAPAAYRTQVNDILLTALGRALCGWSGHDRILIDLEGHGREDLMEGIDLSRTVGWFTSVYPVAIEPLGELAAALKRVKETLRGVPNGGLGYGVLEHLGDVTQRAALSALPRAQVLFNYLGQFDGSFGGSALWRPAEESAGASVDRTARRSHEFAIKGQVYDGELTFTVRYSAARHEPADVTRWVEQFRLELQTLIVHCMGGVRGATPSDFPLARLTQAQLDQLPVTPARVQDLYPLSPMQMGMLFHSVYDPHGTAYINQLRVTLEGLDSARFKAAWEAVLENHAVLRTGFLQVDPALQWPALQWIAKSIALPFAEQDWSEALEWESALDELAQAELTRPFDFAEPPLMRLSLLRLPGGRHHFIWTHHHLLMDGWSASQLLNEVLARYDGRPPEVRGGSYRDFIAWLGARNPRSSAEYWTNRLAMLDEPSIIVSALPKPAGESGYRNHGVSLTSQETARLIAAAARERVTVNTLVQAAWALLISRCLGRRAVCFGATVSGRPEELPGMEHTLGLFINTLPVCVSVRSEARVGDWLRDLQTQNLVSREHDHVPLYEIQRAIDHGGQGLFDTILVFENYPVGHMLRQLRPGGLTLHDISNRERTNYPLAVKIHQGDELTLSFDYAADRLSAQSVEMMSLAVRTLLQSLAESTDGLVGELQLLSMEEARRVDALCVNPTRYSNMPPVHRLIEQQVQVQPRAPALVFGDLQLSYGELNRRANRWAHGLIASGVRPGVKVGIALERSIEMVVGLLAILKAGGAYVPLDPEHPADRLNYMIGDSGIGLLLAQSQVRQRIAIPERLQVLAADTLDAAAASEDDPCVELHEEHLAYVIYTSGSTGRPKGVMVRHRALSHFLLSMRERPGMTHEDTLVAVTSLSFDIAALEIYLPLTSGARVVLASREASHDGEAIARLIERNGATVLQCTPATWRTLPASGWSVAPGRRFRGLCGGEALPPDLARDLRSAGVELWNMYGPTETTIWSSIGVVSDDISLGNAIADTRLRVLDADLSPVPVGVAGELYLGGVGLARGYQARASLTAERFIADPFDNHGARLYRTGDLVRWNASGRLEYLGRIDHQVKIRGVRIELGEIEAALLSQREVSEAVVAAKEGPNGPRLVAYVVTAAEHAIDVSALRERLAKVLPDSMVPSAFVVLDRLPLNANGKVDRKALPDPEFANNAAYEPPRGAVEQTLAAIWSEVLGVESVGRHDSFFALGGDSILSLKLVAQARKRGLALLPRNVFEHHRLCDLAGIVTNVATVSAAIPALKSHEAGPQPLSYAQSRQWFLWQLDPVSTAYHITGALRLKGPLNEQALQASFAALTMRHESLRTVFQAGEDGQARQVVQPRGELALVPIDLSEMSAEERETRVAREAARFTHTPFDLTRGPLLRTALIRAATEEHVLVVVMHHIVSDGWSMQVLLEEFAEQYRARLRSEEPSLPLLPIRYVDYAVWQRNWLEAGEQDRQLIYWKAQLGAEHPVLQLPTDRARGVDSRHRAARHAIELSPELVNDLHRRARAEGATLFMVLLAGLQVLLHRYTEQQDIRVGVPVANRHRPETQRIVGFFVNTQVLRNRVHGRATLEQVLRQAQAAALGAQSHQDLPFEQLVEAMQPERRLGRSPLFQVMFNHQRRDRRVLDQLPGLAVETYELAESEAQFELTVDSIEASDGKVDVSFIYAQELFDAQTIQRMAGHYVAVLRALAEQPGRAVGEVALLSETERARLRQWGSNAQRYENAEPVHRLIERRVKAHPHALALVLDDEGLSYAELNRRANRLAHRLIALGVKPEARVGVALERSNEMVVVLLAILKAGGAYVPLEPEYPAERLNYMIENSGVALLLTREHLRERVPVPDSTTVLALDTMDVAGEPEHDPGVELHGDNLAYVIYTSGSTGRPKGAANRHRSLYNRLRWMQDAYQLTAADTVLQKTPFSFDVSVWEFFWPLMVGARLAIARPGDHRDPSRLVELIQRHRVTTLHFVPSMLQAFLAHPGIEACETLERIVCSGEALPAEAQNEVFERLPRVALHNLYGPTEAAIDVTHWACRNDVRSQVPIGRPIADITTHVLDGDLNLAPQGVAGELYLGGIGLARGYWRQSGLTAERFVADPFDDRGGRLYRTGDLVRWNAQGELEYLGRIDHQVKIRGFRIELGDIEAQLFAQPEVREAVVVSRDRGARGAQLVAYVSLMPQQFLDTGELRARLAKVVPEYMVPSAIVVLETLPLNPNGKVDRKALPEFSSDVPYEPPQGEIEQTLAAIWAEVLGVERVGRHDNFFERGGHSLAALQVSAQSSQRLSIQLPLKLLFEQPSLKEYSTAVSAVREQALSQEDAELDRMSALLEALEN